MNYKNLDLHSWKRLDRSGNLVSGYPGTRLSANDTDLSPLLIFIDSAGKYHLVIETNSAQRKEIADPKVNGLRITMAKYRFEEAQVKEFIDLMCTMESYLPEFNEITKEIAEQILDKKQESEKTVNDTIRKWKTFWSKQARSILSEEEQIGIICELKIIEALCVINPFNAITAWRGPLGEKHDLVFTDWAIEVKGCTGSGHIHTINGIDQLLPPLNKKLALASFVVSKSENPFACSIPDCVRNINTYLTMRPDLSEKLNEHLSYTGYSPIFEEDYRKFKIEILHALLFNVDEVFPSLTSVNLKQALTARISAIRYDLDLQGIEGIILDKVNWSQYCY